MLSIASCSALSGAKKSGSPKPAKQTEAVVGADNKAAPATGSELKGKIDGEWIIVKCGEAQIVRDTEMPYIYFEEKDNRFYASNGCNTLNGFYSLAGNAIGFANVLSTMQDCPDVPFTGQISRVLADGVKLTATYEHKGDESYLYLSQNSGKPLLTLRRHNMEPLTGQWEVEKIDDAPIDDPEVNIFIDIAELKVHGNSGCNYFNGAILIDPLYPNSISFSQMGVTRKMCPNMDVERTFLVALEQTQSYKLTDKDTLKLVNDQGKTVLVLKRAK